MPRCGSGYRPISASFPAEVWLHAVKGACLLGVPMLLLSVQAANFGLRATIAARQGDLHLLYL